MKINDLIERAFENPSSALQLYLMTSYLYYHRFASVISDTTYDKLCKFILDNYDDFEHNHKYLVDKDSLRAGTGFTLREEDYPKIVLGASSILLREYNIERNTEDGKIVNF